MRLFCKAFAAALLCIGLAGCGADGEPETPGASVTPGVSISGTAEFGITSR